MINAHPQGSTFSEGTARSHHSPGHLVFELAVLAAFTLELFWLPIFYWTTYESCGDDRDGFVLLPGLLFCVVGCMLGPARYVQAWRRSREISARYRLPFQATCTTLLAVALSPLLMIAYRILHR